MIKNLTIFYKDFPIIEREIAYTFHYVPFFRTFILGMKKEMDLRGFYDELMYIDVLSIKVFIYKTKIPTDLTIILTTDDSLSEKRILNEFSNWIKKFIALTQIDLEKAERKDFSFLQPTIEECLDKMQNLLPPKVSVIGLNRVGKTSVIRRILNKSLDNIPPTMSMDKNYGTLFNIPVEMWDYSDETQNLWSRYLIGSEGVMMVLNSTRKNAIDSKVLIEKTKKEIPHAELVIFANKQDLPEALPPSEIETIISQKVYPISCLDNEQQVNIQHQAAKLLEIKADGIDYKDQNYIINRND